jgi:mono/diheme cytochrome c family protein
LLGGTLVAGLVGCAVGLPAPTELDATRVSSRWPALHAADLEHGRALYAQRCSRCHELFDPSIHAAGQWETAVREMNARAGLSEAEERLVVQYLVAVASRSERHSSVQ